jgi:type I restriction enzyme R subunit
MPFADVFSDYNLDERLANLGFGSRAAYLEAETTIAAKAARTWWTHYLTHVFPNGYKAQIVASHARRRCATRPHMMRWQKPCKPLQLGNPNLDVATQL